jgi:hypothetical protein
LPILHAVLRRFKQELIWLPDCGVLLGFFEKAGGKGGYFVVSLW